MLIVGSLTASAVSGPQYRPGDGRHLAESQHSSTKQAELQFVQASSRNFGSSNIKELNNSSHPSVTEEQVGFQEKASSPAPKKPLAPLGGPERLSTERPRAKQNAEVLRLLEQDENSSQSREVQDKQPSAASRKYDPVSLSMTSLKHEQQDPYTKVVAARKSSSFKFEQNEAARKIWEQSNYTSGFTHQQDQEHSSMSFIGKRSFMEQKRQLQSIEPQPVQNSDSRLSNQEREITVGQQSISTKEKLLLSPKFNTQSSDVASQNGRDEQPVRLEVNEHMGGLVADKNRTLASDVTLYGNKDQDQWTFHNVAPMMNGVVITNADVKRERNASSNQESLLHSESLPGRRESNLTPYGHDDIAEARSRSQVELNHLSLQKLHVHDEKIKKMEQQFKAKFEHHGSLLDDPKHRIDEYMQKKKYLWLNKSLKKIESDFKHNRSLLGLRVLDNLNSKVQYTPPPIMDLRA